MPKIITKLNNCLTVLNKIITIFEIKTRLTRNSQKFMCIFNKQIECKISQNHSYQLAAQINTYRLELHYKVTQNSFVISQYVFFKGKLVPIG